MSSSDTTASESLSDSICSNNPSEDTRKGEVIDMSRWRDKTMTKEVIRRGKGWSAPRLGNEVSIHYVATKEDGALIDSTRDRNQVFTFKVGRKEVLKGLDIAIKTMRWSEISRFTFAGEYGFDETNCPDGVSPGERVVYEVELFYFKLIDLSKKKDGSLTKRIIEPGISYEIASFGSQCRVDIFGKYGDNVFDDRTVTFTVGEAEDEDVIDGIEVAVTKMRKQEKCRLFVKPNYAFGSKGRPDFGIPEDYTELVYEIRLVDFTEAKEPFEYSDSEKLVTSEQLKEKANHYFGSGKYRLAYKQYKHIVKILRHDSSEDLIKLRDESEITAEEFAAAKDKLLYITYQNLSFCCSRLNRNNSALKWICFALKLEPENVKGLFQRGRVYVTLQEHKLAKEDFEAIIRLEADNTLAQNELRRCVVAMKELKETQKKLYSKFFRSPELDEEVVSQEMTAEKKAEEALPEALEDLTLAGDPTATKQDD